MSKRATKDKSQIPPKGKADIPAQYADHLNPSQTQRKGKESESAPLAESSGTVKLTVEANSSDPLDVLEALRAHLASIILTAQQVNELELPSGAVLASVHQLTEFVQMIEFQVAGAINELREDRAIAEASIEEPPPEPKPEEGQVTCPGCRQPIQEGEPCPHCGTVRCVVCGKAAADPDAQPWRAWIDEKGVCFGCAASNKAAAQLLQQHIAADRRAGGAS